MGASETIYILKGRSCSDCIYGAKLLNRYEKKKWCNKKNKKPNNDICELWRNNVFLKIEKTIGKAL